MRIPQYSMPANPRFRLGSAQVNFGDIVGFLSYVVERDQLTIDEYLEAMGQDPFFLVAATGLGKTVAVPVHVLLRVLQACGEWSEITPRVHVVEPRIPIAVDQMKFMNSLWTEYLETLGRKLPPLFGSITSRGHVNRSAVIKFVTTGIFESFARGEELESPFDRVIIDEAHVTVEQNAGVEFAIALARRAGVTVDYMSATVDTTTLSDDLGVANIIRADRQRHVIWRHNLLQPMYEALPGLIEATLINQRTDTRYYPSAEYPRAKEVIAAVTERDRSHGMLVVVNSYAGDRSDIRRLGKLIREQFTGLPVLELASAVIRDAAKEREFTRRLSAIEASGRNYVILSTSVVEMGITFPTLDYLVTMDSGYDQETIGDVSFPVVAPLGVNSLLQRFGRVGRRRPGIAYISREVGADYAELEDEELNAPKTLVYEPIKYPLAAAPLTELAYYACSEPWQSLEEWLAQLALPSRLHENPERISYLYEQIQVLTNLGIVEQQWVTPFGARMERWLGQADLGYVTLLQRRFEDGCDLPELMFWVVNTALSNTPLSLLRAPFDYFVDYDGSHAGIAHELDIWRGFHHEDIALFSFVCYLAGLSPRGFFKWDNKWNSDDIEFFVNLAGIDGQKMVKAAQAIADLWALFCQINQDTARFRRLFGSLGQPELSSMAWNRLSRDLPTREIHERLRRMPGLTRVSLVENPQFGGLDWVGDNSWKRASANQDDTPIRLESEPWYIAELVPSRKATGSEVTWRLSHLGLYDAYPTKRR